METASILRQLALSALPVLVAITFHELSHGFVANRLGDPTAKMLGRLTLNPFAHIDLFGTIILPFMLLIFTNGQFVFGYAKPVPVNPMNFKDPSKGMAITAAAGPLTNLLIAFLSIMLLRFFILPLSGVFPGAIASKTLVPIALMLEASITINIVLAAFNLMPIPPLDGGRVVVGLLPQRQAVSFSKLEPFGFIIVIILIATGIASYFIVPLVNLFMSILKVF